MKNSTDEVVIINKKNRLKEKVVADTKNASMNTKGTISKDAIKRAQKVVADSQDSYKEELNENLSHLTECWSAMQKEEQDLEQRQKDFHRLSNYIADIAGTFGFELMAYFGKSLRDFNDNLKINDKNHRIIVQGHIDVMQVAYQKDLKTADTPEAKELIKMVSQAIQKYSD